jgi:hypothetical protein
MINKIVRVKNIKDDHLMDDLKYWLSKTQDERVSAVEFFRRQAHGDSQRLQRVVRVIQRSRRTNS